MSHLKKRGLFYNDSRLMVSVILSASFISLAAEAQDHHEITALPSSSIKISGDSSVRKFSANSSPLELKGSAQSTKGAPSHFTWLPERLEIKLPVANLKSGERTLDKHMHEALKEELFPLIDVKLSSFVVPSSDGALADTIKMSGEMTVAGVTKPIHLESAISAEGKELRIRGKKGVLMSDFGIKPPVLMMGTLKTRDEIDISFDVILTQSLDAQKAGK